MTQALTVAQTQAMLRAVAAHIQANKETLTHADQAIGDGDHGIGMARGFAAVAEMLDAESFETLDALFKKTGMKLVMSIGGAAGVIFGTLFTGGAKQLAGRTRFDSEALALLLTDGLDAIMTRGKAKPGDKTMIDALAPAAEKAQTLSGEPLDAALADVAAAAHVGMEASRDMIATMGRAKTLAERALGHPDPGAVTVSLILKSMADYVASLETA
jgi:dihydroxyacetone kinase-like protein